MSHASQYRTLIAADRDLREMPLGNQLGARLENMTRIQMDAYPPDWSEADKREMAEKHLGVGS